MYIAFLGNILIKYSFIYLHFCFCIVSFLLITHVISYPSLREIASDDEENNNDLQLELRSILNHLNQREIEQSVESG